jgi:hypothetical protein
LASVRRKLSSISAGDCLEIEINDGNDSAGKGSGNGQAWLILQRKTSYRGGRDLRCG